MSVILFRTYKPKCVLSYDVESGSDITHVLIDSWLTVKAATLKFIPGRGLAISSAKQGKSYSIYNMVKS